MFDVLFKVAIFVVLVWVINRLIRMALKIISLQRRGIPWLCQFLNGFFFRIPVLAPYFYFAGYKTVLELLRESKNKTVAILTGHVERVFVANPADIKQLCITKASKTIKPANLLKPITMYGPNIVSTYGGQEWKLHRALCNPAFDLKHLYFMSEVAVDSMNLLLKQWQKKESSNGSLVIDTQHEMINVTLDIIGKAGFGVDLNVLEDGKKDEIPPNHKLSFRDALETSINLTLIVNVLAPWLLSSPFGGKAKLAMDEVSQYIDEFMEKRRSSNHEGSDLLSMLLNTNRDGVNADDADDYENSKNRNKQDETRTRLTSAELKSDSWVFLLAGHDTSATALQYLLYELAKRPLIQEKMIEEIDSVIGDSSIEPTMDSVKNLTYVNYALQENLRMHSPVPTIVKTITEPIEFESGYKFPAGTLFHISILYVHKDPENWPEPNEFIPERFKTLPKPCTFMPFSTGQRSCIGANFSLIEQALLITKILQVYKVSFPADYDPVKDFKETTNSAVVRPTNLRVTLTRRIK